MTVRVDFSGLRRTIDIMEQIDRRIGLAVLRGYSMPCLARFVLRAAHQVDGAGLLGLACVMLLVVNFGVVFQCLQVGDYFRGHLQLDRQALFQNCG